VFSTMVSPSDGGLLVGILAKTDMLPVYRTDKEAPGVNVTAGSTASRSAAASGRGRGVHHRVQRNRYLHHPQGDLDLRELRMDDATMKSATTRARRKPPTRYGTEGE